MSNFVEEIEKVPGVAVRSDELLSLHTTLAVGGPCDFMVWVSSKHALKAVLEVARKFDLPVTVLGNGSNVLVRDGGIAGLVLRLVDEFADITVNGLQIRAGAGASLAEVVNRATAAGIGGLEFLAVPSGIGSLHIGMKTMRMNSLGLLTCTVLAAASAAGSARPRLMSSRRY